MRSVLQSVYDSVWSVCTKARVSCEEDDVNNRRKCSVWVISATLLCYLLCYPALLPCSVTLLSCTFEREMSHHSNCFRNHPPLRVLRRYLPTPLSLSLSRNMPLFLSLTLSIIPFYPFPSSLLPPAPWLDRRIAGRENTDSSQHDKRLMLMLATYK